MPREIGKPVRLTLILHCHILATIDTSSGISDAGMKKDEVHGNARFT